MATMQSVMDKWYQGVPLSDMTQEERRLYFQWEKGQEWLEDSREYDYDYEEED